MLTVNCCDGCGHCWGCGHHEHCHRLGKGRNWRMWDLVLLMNLKNNDNKLTHTKIYAIFDPLFQSTTLRGTFSSRPIFSSFGAAFFLCGSRGILIHTRIIWCLSMMWRWCNHSIVVLLIIEYAYNGQIESGEETWMLERNATALCHSRQESYLPWQIILCKVGQVICHLQFL